MPIGREEYSEMIKAPQRFRAVLDEFVERYPELFPADIKDGYQLHDWVRPSVKMPEIRLRRISLNGVDEPGRARVYTIAPSFVLPYRVGCADDVEKALFLRRFGVPFWALNYVFGHDDMYWQRMVAHLGRNDLVGTTLKDLDRLPEHLLADEKHTRLNGEKAYIATTVADDCVLGASLSLVADEPHLTEAYGHFKQEVQRLDPDYQPTTVNTDGWSATQRAWQALFPAITIILCFLHAVLSIRSRGKRLQDTFQAIQQRIWDIYHANHAAHFMQQVADLQVWAQAHVTGPALEAILKLCAKADLFALAFNYPNAYRTSNMLDRQLDPLDRCLYSARYFHGHLMSAEYQVRAWACFTTSNPTVRALKSANTPNHPFTSSMAWFTATIGYRISWLLLPWEVGMPPTQSVRTRKMELAL